MLLNLVVNGAEAIGAQPARADTTGTFWADRVPDGVRSLRAEEGHAFFDGDNGCGLSAETKEKSSIRFFDEVRRARLGLAAVQGIV